MAPLEETHEHEVGGHMVGEVIAKKLLQIGHCGGTHSSRISRTR